MQHATGLPIPASAARPAQAADLQLIGLCRFSYPTLEGGGFRGAAERLFDPHRLQRRLAIFRDLVLPGLARQHDPDFRLVVLIGAGLPGDIRADLAACLRPLPQAQLRVEPDGLPHIETCARVLREARDRARPWVGEFCMDDDDALALDFTAELRRLFVQGAALLAEARRVEIDFCRGHALELAPRPDAPIRVKPVVAPHWVAAQVFIQPSDSRLTAFNFHHSRFWQRHLVISHAGRAMFLRGFHPDNDSGLRWEGLRATPLGRDSGQAPVDLGRFALAPCLAARLVAG